MIRPPAAERIPARTLPRSAPGRMKINGELLRLAANSEEVNQRSPESRARAHPGWTTFHLREPQRGSPGGFKASDRPAADIRKLDIILRRQASCRLENSDGVRRLHCSPPRVRSRWSRPWAPLENFFEVQGLRNEGVEHCRRSVRESECEYGICLQSVSPLVRLSRYATVL